MSNKIQSFKKILVANRGEIAIRILRAASELKIRTVAMYTYEDRYSLHRYKADEAYQIGANDDPLKPYLDIDAIVSVAKANGVDAIHPGYGFLSENVDFVRKCEAAGITFIGPRPEVMDKLGDKVEAKKIAIEANVPIIQDDEGKNKNLEEIKSQADVIGFPIMVKAAAGGGGRGMRVVRDKAHLENSYNEAKGEAAKAFGDDTIFLEKFIENPKHIEVQIMGDNYGNLVHLFERDCSVQRRFQKVVEVAPCISIKKETKEKLYNYALAICKHVDYNNVGTVEFLVDQEENIYFIEVNPRVQVEHTITEEITGIDIVRSQILIAQGYALDHPSIFIKSQDDIKCNGYAIQCRITTENPADNFKPDYGTIIAYRSANGFGIRLDAGNCYAGVKISPFFDSMLVKVSSRGRTLEGAAERLSRALSEFRIRGVQTNIGFMQNVITNEEFFKGHATVAFIEKNPELLVMPRRLDRGTKLLNYLGSVSVNGNPIVKHQDDTVVFKEPKIPIFDPKSAYPEGTKDKLTALGRAGFVDWLKNDKKIHFTDTTFRDAHQSLLATRVRTKDMLAVAEGFAKNHSNIFSMEVWGGATFDVCMRFLHENPWERLQLFRQAMPNVLLQMLIRGSNGVGYKAYPDNLVEKFIEKSWENGMDVFRIFDSLNWVEAMKVSIKTVVERTEALAEACICYTGDLYNKDSKYNLQYYLDLARQLEDEGAHILAIKDMAGLLKPKSAELLVTELKKAIDLPIHLHTHDTSSIQSTTYFSAINAGVDVVDVALSSMSGLTSQPNFNSIVAGLEGYDRHHPFDLKSLNDYSNYWEDMRTYYYPFESGLKAGTAEVYEHEIPGGQYSNLRPQARSLGLENKFEEVKKNYAAVNHLFGDLIKVTPSSKVVGDMALYMTANGITTDQVLTDKTLSFPESVVSLFKGELGQPHGGFPEAVSKMILKGDKPFTDRPNAHLKPIDFESEMKQFQLDFDEYCDELDFISYKLYPKVFRDYYTQNKLYGDVWKLPTKSYLFGLKDNEEIFVEISKGKAIIIKKLYQAAPDDTGYCSVHFEMNGQHRVVRVLDKNAKVDKAAHTKATSDNHIGAPIPGKLIEIKVKEGDKVKENDSLFVIEAMKMETTISASESGTIKKIHLKEGILVESEDMVIELE